MSSHLISFLLGLVGNFIATAVYEKYKAGRTRKAAMLRRKEEIWKEHLSSADPAIRTLAYQEISMKIFMWFILGNVMFGISGISWMLEFFQYYPLSNGIASVASLIAALMFSVAFSWIRLYVKNSKSIEQEITEKIAP
jgi:hypothetical protein